MDELIAFITARLDEAEAAAKHAESQDAQHEQNMPEAEMREAIELASRRERNYDQPWWAANMRYQLDRRRLPGDPDRVLLEVEVKRARLRRYIDTARNADDRRAAGSPSPAVETIRDTLYVEVLHDASAWSYHPDYRAEWKPLPR